MPKRIQGKPPYSTTELAGQLAKARSAKGLTQAELGHRLGMPQSHLSNIERGKTDLRMSSLLELARALDLEVMLIPRQLVPVVRHLTAAQSGDAPEGPGGRQFLYRLPATE